MLIGRDVKMTDMNSVANKVMQEFYRSCLGKKPTFKDDKIAVGAVIREIVNQLQYYHFGDGEDMVVSARALYELADELESL